MLNKLSDVLQIDKVYLVIGFIVWAIAFIHFTFNRRIKGINRLSYIAIFILLPPIAPLYYLIKIFILRMCRKKENIEGSVVTSDLPSKEETLRKAKLNAQKRNTKKAEQTS